MLQTSLLLMKNLNKTETPIFYLKCVLCFQKQPFRFLFYVHNINCGRPAVADGKLLLSLSK